MRELVRLAEAAENSDFIADCGKKKKREEKKRKGGLVSGGK